MKNLIYLIGIAIIFASCTNVIETDEYKSLQAKNDSLETINSTQNAEVFEYLIDFNSIQDNLSEIKKRENIISVNTGDIYITGRREQINEDINTIYDLLKDNQKRLEKLNNKYKNSNYKNKELKKLIHMLNQQISDKNSEIQILNSELKNLNIEIKDLSDALIEVEDRNENQTLIIEAQNNELTKVFYVVGTAKALMENNVITKEGGFIGIGRNSKLDESFNKDYFTEINSDTFTKISIFSKSAKLITNHPKGSYEFEGTKNKVDNLIIKNTNAFWSVSKYLVIEVKN